MSGTGSGESSSPPKISVVMGAYNENDEKKMRRALDSKCVCRSGTDFMAWAQGLHEIPPKEKGFMWEHLVLNEIAAVRLRKDIMHWRGKQGYEVGFVIQGEGKAPIAIEAK